MLARNIPISAPDRLSPISRADFGFAPSQWETVLLCNGVSHWLGASLESALLYRRHIYHYYLSDRWNSISVLHMKRHNIVMPGPAASVWVWHHSERDGVSNHRHLDCLLHRLFRRSKKTPKFRVTGLCERNSSVTGKFPTQKASNTENVFIFYFIMMYVTRRNINARLLANGNVASMGRFKNMSEWCFLIHKST